jgi:hypothetical protein
LKRPLFTTSCETPSFCARLHGHTHDDADRARHRPRIGHDLARGRRHVVTARGRHVPEGGDDRLPLPHPPDGVVELLRGGDGAARGVDAQHDGHRPVLLAEALERVDGLARILDDAADLDDTDRLPEGEPPSDVLAHEGERRREGDEADHDDRQEDNAPEDGMSSRHGLRPR